MSEVIHRTYSLKQLRDQGFNTAVYLAKPLPEGQWLGTLDAKCWGRSVNLHCFFTSDQGRKYLLSAFRTRRGIGAYTWYTPQDGALNLASSEIQPGQQFILTTSVNSKRNPLWKSALLHQIR